MLTLLRLTPCGGCREYTLLHVVPVVLRMSVMPPTAPACATLVHHYLCPHTHIKIQTHPHLAQRVPVLCSAVVDEAHTRLAYVCCLVQLSGEDVVVQSGLEEPLLHTRQQVGARIVPDRWGGV